MSPDYSQGDIYSCVLEGDEDNRGLRREGFPVTLDERRGRTVGEVNCNNKTGLFHFLFNSYSRFTKV